MKCFEQSGTNCKTSRSSTAISLSDLMQKALPYIERNQFHPDLHPALLKALAEFIVAHKNDNNHSDTKPVVRKQRRHSLKYTTPTAVTDVVDDGPTSPKRQSRKPPGATKPSSTPSSPMRPSRRHSMHGAITKVPSQSKVNAAKADNVATSAVPCRVGRRHSLHSAAVPAPTSPAKTRSSQTSDRYISPSKQKEYHLHNSTTGQAKTIPATPKRRPQRRRHSVATGTSLPHAPHTHDTNTPLPTKNKVERKQKEEMGTMASSMNTSDIVESQKSTGLHGSEESGQENQILEEGNNLKQDCKDQSSIIASNSYPKETSSAEVKALQDKLARAQENLLESRMYWEKLRQKQLEQDTSPEHLLSMSKHSEDDIQHQMGILDMEIRREQKQVAHLKAELARLEK